MIEKDKIKWIRQPGERTYVYYKEVKLDISTETIQDIYHGLLDEREIELIILDSYQKNLRLYREQKLKELLND